MDTLGASASASTLWIVLAVLASLAALVQTARIAWERFARTHAIRARSRRAVEGELEAEPLLRRAGYDVLARQVPGRWTIFADGEPHEVALRADLLVEKDGRRFVAEVKTGRLAPRLDQAATRRQLLEYKVAFDVDGVLLVDADAARVTVVELGLARESDPGSEAERSRVPWPAVFVIGVAVGALVVWFGRS